MRALVLVSLILGFMYGVLRFWAGGNFPEFVASGSLLAMFIALAGHRLGIRSADQIGRLISPPMRPWLSIGVAVVVIGVEVVKNGRTISLASLDLVFAFAFFTAFSSLFIKRP